jgi:hypothetical protein
MSKQSTVKKIHLLNIEEVDFTDKTQKVKR